MFAVESTRLLVASLFLLGFVLLYCVNNYLSNNCVLLLTGESFTISNCKVNQDLVNLIREQRDYLSCHN
nr:triple gene block protein 3 [Cowpea mild mottle virus]